MRIFFSIFFTFVLLTGLVLLAQRAEEPVQEPPAVVVPADDTHSKDISVKPKRQREGTVMKQEKVFFRQNGNRTLMYRSQDHQRFTVLENLTLDRILNAAAKSPEHQFWKVDGTFTEFRGENYVLIQRAVVAAP